MQQMLGRMFQLAHRAAHTNLKDITDEDALRQPKPGGNCIQWVLAHIVATRDRVAQLIGAEPVLPDALRQRFGRPAAPIVDGRDARPLADWIADFDRSQERLGAAIAALPAERLHATFDGAKLPGRPTTLAEALAFFHFHESYHVGQLGMLRRLVGKEGAIR
jgi:uncharacterized damage-inducible protein DinB